MITDCWIDSNKIKPAAYLGMSKDNNTELTYLKVDVFYESRLQGKSIRWVFGRVVHLLPSNDETGMRRIYHPNTTLLLPLNEFSWKVIVSLIVYLT